MIDRISLYKGSSFDPLLNLAIEQYLLENVKEGELILYLWQNENTVVIGRNQNAWKECRLTLLSQEGGRLARRLSGGGAVFHDLGNLNFTFICRTEDYSLDRHFAVIREACARFSIETERSGRNDLLASGRKFSGNAFYKRAGHSYHHGTILVDVDMEKMGRYLNPSKAKLASRGVDSVRSRTINLKELAPDITIEALSDALCDSFEKVCGLKADVITDDMLDFERIGHICERNGSYDWRFGVKLEFSCSFEARFPWGEVLIELVLDGGRIKDCAVYTDAMEFDLAGEIREALCGVEFMKDTMINAIAESDIREEIKADICELIEEQDI